MTCSVLCPYVNLPLKLYLLPLLVLSYNGLFIKVKIILLFMTMFNEIVFIFQME